MKYPVIISFLIFVFGAGKVSGQTNFNALSWKQNLAYNSYLLRDVHQQYADRGVELNKALQTKEGILGYRDELKKRYKKILGNFPEKQNLNPKVLGSSQQKGFRVEKIIFESLPKRYVTANLYLPEGKGPFPASLELCGHGMSGKIGSAEAVLMALNGIAVLVVDPIGQGERVQFLDENGKPSTRGATTEHTLLNAGCNLLGTSLAAYELFDNQRAIDYLESRVDIDQNRLAVYGSSGGATQTAYLIGVEDRLKVACICSYFSQRERVFELSGPSDGCQHIPGEGEAHIEISDWITMFAPKPVLVMSGLYDFVDYWGAQQGSAELIKVYDAMGAGGAFEQFTAECGHGMPKVKREALASWFRRWLCNDTKPVLENQGIRIDESDQLCTTTAQVNTAFADVVSIPQYNLELAKKMSNSRLKFLQQDDALIHEKILQLLGRRLPQDHITPELTGFVQGRTFDTYKYQILRKGEMPVPCLVIMPERVAKDGKVVLYLHESGKETVLSDETTLNNYVNQGDILVVADLRGYGETTDPSNLNDSKYWNKEYRNTMISLHIGKTIVGQRLIDIISLVDFISADDRFAGHDIRLKAIGSYGPVAVHATYFDRRIVHTEISRSIKSYVEYLQNPLQRDVYTNVIPHVLNFYDLTDLTEKAGKGRVIFID